MRPAVLRFRRTAHSGNDAYQVKFDFAPVASIGGSITKAVCGSEGNCHESLAPRLSLKPTQEVSVRLGFASGTFLELSVNVARCATREPTGAWRRI